MKNLVYVIALVAMIFGLQSCDSCSSPASNGGNGEKLVYNVVATAEGQVEFSWFNGGAEIDGNAVVHQCNDTLKLLAAPKNAIPLATALESNDAETSAAADLVNSMLQVKGVEGNYHLTVKGYVKYGPMVFMIDEEYPKDSI